MKTAGYIMTKEVITVTPDTSLIEAVNLILKYSFNGLPVIINSMVVGIITEHDMVTKGSGVHIPTLLKLFGGLGQKDTSLLKDELKRVVTMKVKDVMNPDPITLDPNDSILKVVNTFTEHHQVNPIPIVDSTKRLVGVISRSDMLKFMGDINPKLFVGNDEKSIDKNVDKFINNFENKFVLVTKGRARWWIVASILFAVVGFAIAWFLILRVNL